ncbi:cytochrome P450 [Nocardia sp. BMG111209]|uniref:cytochrome P450 n=1 Tax=Nocardia sp. BMG111209 TaxID=1160137 RepID=UPI000368E445|nr:cytochrome P450 [Nocardia sp. BMG111209]
MSDTDRLTGPQALTTLVDLGFAPVASGVIARRRVAMRLLDRFRADHRSVARMHRLRREFGAGPVELAFPGRRIVIVTDPGDVARVLDGAPDPFHPANREKRAALRQFQPHGVLLSQGWARDIRRVLNEGALNTGEPMHRLAAPFTAIIGDESTDLIDAALAHGRLDAGRLITDWWRLVRRLVLGPAARDDEDLTDELWRLRSAANWSLLLPQHRRLRDRFIERLYCYALSPEPASLLGALAAQPASPATDPIGQIPHWLFAFDAAGIALARTLALLATHPEQQARARADAAAPQRPDPRLYLRACVLESLRLWPTTPVLLRDLTEDTEWNEDRRPVHTRAGAAVLISAPAFHRDPDMLPFAHEFVPDIWLDGRAEQYPQLVPFSAGPAACPGRNVVLLVTSTLLANLLDNVDFRLDVPLRTSADEPLPPTLDHYRLGFTTTPASLRAV